MNLWHLLVRRSWLALLPGVLAMAVALALPPESPRGGAALAERGPSAEATPSCPGANPEDDPSGAFGPLGMCEYTVNVVGNTYVDWNRNGRYDPNAGQDSRLPGVVVRLIDVASGQAIGQAVTNQTGYYRFPGLPKGPTYRAEVLVPEQYVPTTPTYRDMALQNFSTFWCCSARADFGLAPGRHAPTPSIPPPGGPPGHVASPPCCEIPYGRQIHLPILNYAANENVCSTIVEVQNVGAWPSKALLLVWGAPGFCPPQCTGPLKVECSGLLAPGTAWHFVGAQLPSSAKSAMVFSAPAISTEEGPLGGGVGGDVFADLLCEALFHQVVGNCNEFRRFKKAFNEYGTWQTPHYAFDFRRFAGASLAAEVVRKCPGDTNPLVDVTGGYLGIADEMLGAYDPVYAGFAFFTPLVYADEGGFTSWLYIQNGGYECSSIELWFKAQDDCNRPRVCDVLTLAPGETHQFDASQCVGPGFTGSAWVRGSQPLSIVVDLIGRDVLMSYTGNPSELKYTFEGAPAFTTGSQVAYGPLTYSEYQGWDTLIQVQNLSQVVNAKVKVYFLDRSGGVITTLIDWICPGGSQGYYLPVISEMPGNWVGTVRAESQDWFLPGQPSVGGPNITAVATMMKYADATRTQPLEAVAYSLFPEQRAYDWQVGSGYGGLWSGVGRIGIPSLMKDVGRSGLTTELAIANLVPVPGFTDFVIYFYDQNGLIGNLCEKLSERQVEYLDVAASLNFLPDGFKGSAVISAVYWDHRTADETGRQARNVLGLASVKIERTGTVRGSDVPGDESAASQGFPIIGRFTFGGPWIQCPGVPVGGPPIGGPIAPTPYPTNPTALPPGLPPTALPPPPPPGPPVP